MRTAFTDRSLRMREDKYSHLGLGHFNDKRGAQLLEDYEAKKGKHMADCKCPVCRPFEVAAAGQVSSLVQYNRHNQFFGSVQRESMSHLDEEGEVSSARGSTLPKKHAMVHSALDSKGVKHNLQHMYYEPTDLEKQGRDDSAYQDAEIGISAELGRKRRTPAAIQQFASQGETWNASAGFYDKEPPSGKNVDFARMNANDSIGNIVPALTEKPRIRLTGTFDTDFGTKAYSEFAREFTPFTKRLAVQQNAELLRYESGCQILRSSSCPPETSRSRWNPITHDGDASGMLGYLARETHDKGMKDTSSLGTMSTGTSRGNLMSRTISKDSFGFGPGGNVTPRNFASQEMAGVTSQAFSEKKFRQWRGSSSPRVVDPSAFSSSNMEQVTGNHAVHCAPEERQRRLASDKEFAEICKVTENMKGELSRKAIEIKDKMGSHHSHQVASTLQWTN
jgi:hypothetical protein